MLQQNAIALLLGFVAVGAAIGRRIKKQVFLYPVANPTITSPFGERIHPITKLKTLHNGIDLGGKIGQVIAAPMNGKVTYVTTTTGGGLQMAILHPNGFTTVYLHLSKVLVSVGQEVTTSQVIANMGNTGESTGPHLHFSLKDKTGAYIDPVPYLK